MADLILRISLGVLTIESCSNSVRQVSGLWIKLDFLDSTLQAVANIPANNSDGTCYSQQISTIAAARRLRSKTHTPHQEAFANARQRVRAATRSSFKEIAAIKVHPEAQNRKPQNDLYVHQSLRPKTVNLSPRPKSSLSTMRRWARRVFILGMLRKAPQPYTRSSTAKSKGTEFRPTGFKFGNGGSARFNAFALQVGGSMPAAEC